MPLKVALKRLYFRLSYHNKNVRLEKGTKIGFYSCFEGYNRIGANTEFDGKIGLCSYIGENCVIFGSIGRFCSIASGTTTLCGTHPTNFVSTSPVFYSTTKTQCGITFSKRILFDEYRRTSTGANVEIGNDVWIGGKVLILPGISIGNGAIIGAGTVLTKDVPPYAIVAGNPGKVIRYRYSEQQIKELQKSNWWDYPLSQLETISESFCIQYDEDHPIDSFIRILHGLSHEQ